MIKDNYELEILVNGKPVKEYFHEGKFYIEGKEKTTYSLRVKNNGYRRITVIPTVDGLNVITGKPASFSDRGYVINGYSSMTIEGWRTSDQEVAEFFFSNPEKSYGNKKGKANNIGVIGCAVFKEKSHDIFNNFFLTTTGTNFPSWTSTPTSGNGQVLFKSTTWNYDSQSGTLNISANNNGTVQNAAYKLTDDGSIKKVQELGTGFGESKKSEVVKVDFDREDAPSAVFEIFYNTRKQLENIGINFNSRPQYISPSAFPAESEYCRPPED